MKEIPIKKELKTWQIFLGIEIFIGLYFLSGLRNPLSFINKTIRSEPISLLSFILITIVLILFFLLFLYLNKKNEM